MESCDDVLESDGWLSKPSLECTCCCTMDYTPRTCTGILLDIQQGLLLCQPRAGMLDRAGHQQRSTNFLSFNFFLRQGVVLVRTTLISRSFCLHVPSTGIGVCPIVPGLGP